MTDQPGTWTTVSFSVSETKEMMFVFKRIQTKTADESARSRRYTYACQCFLSDGGQLDCVDHIVASLLFYAAHLVSR